MDTLHVPVTLIMTMGQLLGSRVTDTMVCPVCGEYVALHEWIGVDTEAAKVVTCDRA